MVWGVGMDYRSRCTFYPVFLLLLVRSPSHSEKSQHSPSVSCCRKTRVSLEGTLACGRYTALVLANKWGEKKYCLGETQSSGGEKQTARRPEQGCESVSAMTE